VSKQKSYLPEERLGILRPSKTGKSLLLLIDELQLGRAERGELERKWRIPRSSLERVLEGKQPYCNIYVSKAPPTAKAEIEEEKKILAYEESSFP